MADHLVLDRGGEEGRHREGEDLPRDGLGDREVALGVPQAPERLLEVRGAAGTGSAGYRYALTDLGRQRAQQFLEINQYVGPAPVPLRQYVEVVRSLATHRPSGRDLLSQVYFIGVKSQTVVLVTGAFTGMVLRTSPLRAPRYSAQSWVTGSYQLPKAK